ncbi:TMV resistance protein [Salix suchowensis]|nr:TMV resistance protein [Salix suchowensis]
MLPASFTSFSSLKELDLSNPGLSDAISSIDLGSLSYLENLNLSGNGFFNLPSGISRLPKLLSFTVERCKNLLSISELPSSVLYLSINDCTSIERGTEAMEGLALDVQGLFSTKSFTKMKRLQLLQITGALLAGSYNLLPRELIWLEFPLKSLPSDFHLSELVILDMQRSKVQKLWKGTKDCNSLTTLPESMGNLKTVQTLNVTECWQLEKLPNSLGGLESLIELFTKGTANKNNRDYAKRVSLIGLEESMQWAEELELNVKSRTSNGIELFDTTTTVTFDRNSTKHSWIQRVPLTGLEESLQGVEELELNVKVRLMKNVQKCWVEKYEVHLVMEKSKADSDIHGEKWDHEIDLHALGSSTTDDQRLESSLIREL